MTTKLEVYESGDQFGAKYTFEFANEGFPMHNHSPDEEHSINCIKGRVLVYGDGWQQLLLPGDVWESQSNIQHEVAALDDGTETLNILLNGKTEKYQNVTSEMLSNLPTSIVTPPAVLSQ